MRAWAAIAVSPCSLPRAVAARHRSAPRAASVRGTDKIQSVRMTIDLFNGQGERVIVKPWMSSARVSSLIVLTRITVLIYKSGSRQGPRARRRCPLPANLGLRYGRSAVANRQSLVTWLRAGISHGYSRVSHLRSLIRSFEATADYGSPIADCRSVTAPKASAPMTTAGAFNSAALRFYERQGFRQAAILDGLVIDKVDELLMRKRLDCGPRRQCGRSDHNENIA